MKKQLKLEKNPAIKSLPLEREEVRHLKVRTHVVTGISNSSHPTGTKDHTCDPTSVPVR